VPKAEFDAVDWTAGAWARGAAAAAMIAAGLIGASPQAAQAEDADSGAKAAPRATVQIGDASIVLIAANDHLYAFVDRVDDNAPVADAVLSVASAGGAAIDISRVGDGLFAAPFDRTGRSHDTFKVSLRSAVATGDASAEMAYDDAPDSAAATSAWYSDPLAVAAISASIGAIGAALLVLRLRGGWRRAVAPSAADA
jgi:hypothetical protein